MTEHELYQPRKWEGPARVASFERNRNFILLGMGFLILAALLLVYATRSIEIPPAAPTNLNGKVI